MFLSEFYSKRNIFETASPIELAEMLFAAIKKHYPEVLERHGEEMVSNAIMDHVEDADIHSMSELDIAMHEVIDDLQGNVTKDHEDNPVVNAITHRILMQRTDLLQKYGPEAVGQAIDSVAEWVGDVEEIGSSDVSGWIRDVERSLADMNPEQGVAEGKGLQKRVKVVKGEHAGQTGWIRQVQHGVFKGAPKTFYVDLDNGKQADNLPGTALRLVKDEQGVAEGTEQRKAIAQGWAAKHPNIDAEIAQVANKLAKYGDYERTTSGGQYAAAKSLAAELHRLKQIKKIISGDQGVAEAHLDPSGLQAAAEMVRDYIITAEVDGKVKKFRVRGMTGPNAAKERFLRHASMAKVMDVKPEQGVAEGVEIIDQDYDLDQQIYTLNVDGNKISFTYWDYENNFQNPDIKDIYQQAKEQLGKKLSSEQIKDVARVVFKSFKQGVAEETNPTDTVEMDVPLLIRALEYAREDAKDDMDLHRVVERMIDAAKAGKPLNMDDYNRVFGAKEEVTEGLTRIYSDQAPKLLGLSFSELDKLSESSGDNFSNFDKAIKKNLNLPKWTNTMEMYGVYLRKLTENKSGQKSSEGEQSKIEQELFNELSQRSFDSIDSASIGDKVSLLHLTTLNIPGHKVVARLNGFLTPKEIVNITVTGSFQQLEFADGSKYPEKDGGDIFQQTQGWNMTKLFSSREAASKAYAFYGLVGKKLSSELDFQTNVESSVTETRLYYTVAATLKESLAIDFSMKQDATGWYLTPESGRAAIMEAHRAFGVPKVKQVKLKEFNHNPNVITGAQNNISPIGSIARNIRKAV